MGQGAKGTEGAARPILIAQLHVQRPVEPRTDARKRHDHFVDRSSELAICDALLARVAAGGSATLLLPGDAGIGKSRLIEEFAGRHRTAARFVEVRCAANSRDPLAPILAMIDRMATAAPLERRALHADFDETVARMRAALTLATAQAPVVLVLGDAQWSSDATLEALDHLGDLSRVFAIVTFRADEMPLANEAILARFSSRGALRVTLPPLAPDDAATLVRARTTDDSRSLERREIERIVYLSGGNPGIALEIAAAPDLVAASIDALAARTLASLDGPAQETVVVASLLGDRFDLALLCAVLERDERTVLDALQRATLARAIPIRRP
jgi:predicted ATPase